MQFQPVSYRANRADTARLFKLAARPFRAAFADGYRRQVMPGATDEVIDRAMLRLVECSSETRDATVRKLCGEVVLHDGSFER